MPFGFWNNSYTWEQMTLFKVNNKDTRATSKDVSFMLSSEIWMFVKDGSDRITFESNLKVIKSFNVRGAGIYY